MRLPIEVCEAVIDQASDDTESLRAFSLTCSTLLPRSRYHLFSSIRIWTVAQMESSRDFLDAHPWLLPLVHKVALSFIAPEDETKCQHVRVLDIVPVDLLTRLPNLRAWSMGPILCNNEHSLSLHRSALSLYGRLGGRIQNLELSSIFFDRLSDFTGLVSSFTSIHILTCSSIEFRWKEELDPPLYVGRTGILTRPLQISTLIVHQNVDIRAVEYMLSCSGFSLNNLTLTTWKDSERLEKSICWLSRLSSLTLVLRPVDSGGEGFSELIIFAARILQSVERTFLKDVRVEFAPDPIAELGFLVSGPDAPLEACKSLEQALLIFPSSGILVLDPVNTRRAGRGNLWSPIIQSAFPILNERRQLTLSFMCCKRSALLKTFNVAHGLRVAKADSPDPPGHEYDVTAIVASHDSRWFVTSSWDDTIIVWDTSSGTVVQEWLAHQHGVTALGLSPDSRRLFSAGGHTMGIVWAIDGVHVQKVAALEGHTDTIETCAWSHDGALIASAGKDKTVCVWDGHTFQQRGRLLDHNQPEALRCSPDSRYFAWISGSDCCLWRPLTGEEPKRLRSHPDPTRSRTGGVHTFAFAFDRESRRIATTHGDSGPDACVVRVWDIATGAALVVLVGHSRSVTDISFSPDGRLLVSASPGGSVRIWDADSGKQTDFFRDTDENSRISRVLFCPDGKHIATASKDNTGRVRLLKLGDDSELTHSEIVDDHGSLVWHIVFTPCGKFLASGDGEGIVLIYPLSNSKGN